MMDTGIDWRRRSTSPWGRWRVSDRTPYEIIERVASLRKPLLVAIGILPVVIGYLIALLPGPWLPALLGDLWRMAPLVWGAVLLAAWFFLGRRLGVYEEPVTGFLVGILPAVILGALYVHQFHLVALPARSPLLSLLGQVYPLMAVPVTTRLLLLFVRETDSGTILLLSYGVMMACFALGFTLEHRDRSARKARAHTG